MSLESIKKHEIRFSEKPYYIVDGFVDNFLCKESYRKYEKEFLQIKRHWAFNEFCNMELFKQSPGLSQDELIERQLNKRIKIYEHEVCTDHIYDFVGETENILCYRFQIVSLDELNLAPNRFDLYFCHIKNPRFLEEERLSIRYQMESRLELQDENATFFSVMSPKGFYLKWHGDSAFRCRYHQLVSTAFRDSPLEYKEHSDVQASEGQAYIMTEPGATHRARYNTHLDMKNRIARVLLTQAL